MLFSELRKIMANKFTFLGFRGGGDRPPLDPPLAMLDIHRLQHELIRTAEELLSNDMLAVADKSTAVSLLTRQQICQEFSRCHLELTL